MQDTVNSPIKDSSIKVDICVVGGGSGGLSVAAGAAQMGAKVALCEQSQMGGDCLNHGCIPSKALIEASRILANVGKAPRFGVKIPQASVDFKRLHEHIRSVQATIAPNDSVERFESLGVVVLPFHAQFIDKNTLRAGPHTVQAKYFVLATGSSPSIPAIEGLDSVPYLTNENIFDLKEAPRHLLVIGGGPIGVELACAYAWLGVPVSIFSNGPLMGRLDTAAVAIVKKQLISLGVNIIVGARIDRVIQEKDGLTLNYTHKSVAFTSEASHLLVATGRTPNVKKLGLENTAVEFNTKDGILVDAHLRTKHRHIYAIGDTATSYRFTHIAAYHAGIVLRKILFRMKAKAFDKIFLSKKQKSVHRPPAKGLPWVLYTTPEIAHVGFDLKEAASLGAQILELPYSSNDRAQAALAEEGVVLVAVNKKGYILGATIAGENAGDLLTPWILAIDNKIPLKKMANFIAPYPTLSELNKRIAGSYFTPWLYSEKVRILVQLLLKLPR